MPIAAFGKKVFQVSSKSVYTFDGIAWGGSLDTESQEKVGSKPSTYIKGSSLDSLSFDVSLRADLGHDVRKEIESWEAIRDKRTPDIFILGQKPLGTNKWLLKSVNVSDTVIDGNGRMSKALLKLEFEEYVRPGKKQPEKSAAAATTKTTLNLVPEEIYNPPTKAEDKRSNPNLTASIMNFNPQNNMMSG
jgi:hypothetical protein